MQQNSPERLKFIDLNLLPQESWVRNHSALYAAAAALLLVAALLLIPLNRANSSAADDAESLRAELQRIDRELVEEQASLGRLRELRLKSATARQAIEDLAAERDAVLGSKPKLSGAVARLLANLPPGAAVSSVTSGDGTVLLAGQAPDSETALGYARKLDDTGAFSSVQIASLGLDEGGAGVSFTVEVAQ
ncbi:MAG: hypothetical protein WEE64_00485 [Dehalococcoidia bacterium]